MLNTPSRNQKLLALLIIVISLGFMVVAYKANQQTQNIAPRAQVSTNTGNPTTTNTGANTTKPTVVTQLPPNGQPLPPEAVPTVSTCQEGVKSILADPGNCTVDPKTAGGSPSTTATGGTTKDVPKSVLKGVLCWNDNGDGIQDSTEFLALNTGCITREEMTTYLTQAQDFCKGKKAPSCGGSGGGVITPGAGGSGGGVGPTSAVPPTNCATKSKGDVNCDGRIDLVDFNIWLSEFNGLSKTLNADVNGDGRVSGADFDVWRQTYTSGS